MIKSVNTSINIWIYCGIWTLIFKIYNNWIKRKEKVEDIRAFFLMDDAWSSNKVVPTGTGSPPVNPDLSCNYSVAILTFTISSLLTYWRSIFILKPKLKYFCSIYIIKKIRNIKHRIPHEIHLVIGLLR